MINKLLHLKTLTKAYLLLFCILPIFTTSCIDISKNPPDSTPSASVDSTPFLGNWKLIQIFESLPWETLEITISQEPNNNLSIIFNDGSNTQTLPCLLTDVNDQIIVSIQDVSIEMWVVLKISLEEEGKIIKLYSLNHSKLKDAIQNQVLEGKIFDDDGIIGSLITSGGSEFRSYISSEASVFEIAPFAVFQKVP